MGEWHGCDIRDHRRHYWRTDWRYRADDRSTSRARRTGILDRLAVLESRLLHGGGLDDARARVWRARAPSHSGAAPNEEPGIRACDAEDRHAARGDQSALDAEE